MSKNVRFQVVVNDAMADMIDDISEVMCMSKSEFIRMCIAQTIYGYRVGTSSADSALHDPVVISALGQVLCNGGADK